FRSAPPEMAAASPNRFYDHMATRRVRGLFVATLRLYTRNAGSGEAEQRKAPGTAAPRPCWELSVGLRRFRQTLMVRAHRGPFNTRPWRCSDLSVGHPGPSRATRQHCRRALRISRMAQRADSYRQRAFARLK